MKLLTSIIVALLMQTTNAMANSTSTPQIEQDVKGSCTRTVSARNTCGECTSTSGCGLNCDWCIQANGNINRSVRAVKCGNGFEGDISNNNGQLECNPGNLTTWEAFYQ